MSSVRVRFQEIGEVEKDDSFDEFYLLTSVIVGESDCVVVDWLELVEKKGDQVSGEVEG